MIGSGGAIVKFPHGDPVPVVSARPRRVAADDGVPSENEGGRAGVFKAVAYRATLRVAGAMMQLFAVRRRNAWVAGRTMIMVEGRKEGRKERCRLVGENGMQQRVVDDTSLTFPPSKDLFVRRTDKMRQNAGAAPSEPERPNHNPHGR